MGILQKILEQSEHILFLSKVFSAKMV